MAREVNVYYDAVAPTGKKKQTAEYALSIRHEWTRNKGDKKVKADALTFPAVMDDMPEARRVAYITEILLAEARLRAAVDNEEG